MTNYYDKVISKPDDFSIVLDAIDYYNAELEQGRNEVEQAGVIETISAKLPGLLTYRYYQFQEVEGILEHLNILLRKTKGEKFRFYMEKYNKVLSSRDAEKYSDTDPDVVTLSQLINHVALIRNKYMGLIKGFDSKGFQLGTISKMRIAGMEDATLDPIYIR